MTTKTLLMVAGSALAVIIAALLYHHFTVTALESRLAEANQSFTDFQTSLARQTLNALQTNAATVEKMLSEREERHEAIRAAGHSALAAINAEPAAPIGAANTANRPAPARATANLDLPLPVVVSDELARLHSAARAAGAGSGAPNPAGSPVPGKNPAAAPGHAHPAHPGRMDSPAADLDR